MLAHAMVQVILAMTLVAPEEQALPATPAVPVRWQFQAPSECPDAEAARRWVETLLGRVLLVDPEAEPHVDVRITRDGRTFRLELTTAVLERSERRSLVGERCDELVEASALIVAVALAPFAETNPTSARPPRDDTTRAQPDEAHASSPVPEAPPESSVAVERPPASPSLPNEPPPSLPPRSRIAAWRHRAALFIGGGGAFSIVGPATGALEGGLGWLSPHARVDASARHGFALDHLAADEAGGRISLTAAALRGCYVPRFAAFELTLCGGAEAGAMRAAGTGRSVSARTRTAPWFAGLVGIGGGWESPIGLAVRLQVDLGLVPWRPVFHLGRPGSPNLHVFETTPANVRATLVLEARLPRLAADARSGRRR